MLSAEEMGQLLNSIELATKKGDLILVGLRDRALISLMGYTFARVGAAVHMKVEDFIFRSAAAGSGCTKKVATTPSPSMKWRELRTDGLLHGGILYRLLKCRGWLHRADGLLLNSKRRNWIGPGCPTCRPIRCQDAHQ